MQVVLVDTQDGKVGWPLVDAPLKKICRSPLYTSPDRQSRYGYWVGKPIIGRDTPINGGVYLGLGHLGEGNREVLLVDDRDPTTVLRELYDRLLGKIRYLDTSTVATHPLESQSIVSLRAVMEITYESMSRDDDRANELGRLLLRRLEEQGDESGIVPLDSFIQQQIGTCRHHALLACYLVERLICNRVVEGRVSLDRCEVIGRGRHAWARHECSEGVFVVDMARNYLGRIDGPQASSWYQRPEEREGDLSKEKLDLWDRMQRPETIATLVDRWSVNS